MSSDSDEDELLRMALKEQAHRSVVHETPQPRKPVANYVQQPQSAARKHKPGRSQGKKHEEEEEEEEESEVEMLSISSGDEEVSRDRGLATKIRARGVRRDDDFAWDGDEPNCWKRVDEAEVLLARRVHEKRETRTAPVAFKYEPKPSAAIGVKGLTLCSPSPMAWNVLTL